MALSIKPAVPCSEGLVLRPEAHELASARLGQLRIECGQGHLDRACGGMWACAFGAVGAFGVYMGVHWLTAKLQRPR